MPTNKKTMEQNKILNKLKTVFRIITEGHIKACWNKKSYGCHTGKTYYDCVTYLYFHLWLISISIEYYEPETEFPPKSENDRALTEKEECA